MTCFALRLQGRTAARGAVEDHSLLTSKASTTLLGWCLGALAVQRLACPGCTAASQRKETGLTSRLMKMEELLFAQAARVAAQEKAQQHQAEAVLPVPPPVTAQVAPVAAPVAAQVAPVAAPVA